MVCLTRPTRIDHLLSCIKDIPRPLTLIFAAALFAALPYGMSSNRLTTIQHSMNGTNFRYPTFTKLEREYNKLLLKKAYGQKL